MGFFVLFVFCFSFYFLLNVKLVLLGAVSEHNSQLYEGCSGISVYRAVLFSTWPGCNGAYCSCKSSLSAPPGCTYRYYIWCTYWVTNHSNVLQRTIMHVSKSKPIVASFHVSFRALHGNSIDRGSDDGDWHWWGCAGLLGYGPGSVTCQSSLKRDST